MSDLQSKIDRLKTAAPKKLDFWRAQLTRKTSRVQEKEIEIEELHEEVEEKEIIIEELIEEMKEKEIEIDDLREKVEEKEIENKELQEKGDEKGFEIEKLEEVVEEKQVEIEELKSQLLLSNTQFNLLIGEQESKLTETEQIIEHYVREKKFFLQFIKKIHEKHC